jgi:hypothetical protein
MDVDAVDDTFGRWRASCLSLRGFLPVALADGGGGGGCFCSGGWLGGAQS